MKQNNKIAALRSAASSIADDKQPGQPYAGTHGEAVPAGALGQHRAPEGHAGVMSRGELIFLLRDVQRYWSTPRISFQEIEQLEQQDLIQRSITAICAIRLTEHGVRFKNGQPIKAR